MKRFKTPNKLFISSIIFYSLVFIFVITKPENRTLGVVLLSIALAVLASWWLVWSIQRYIKKQTNECDDYNIQLKDGEYVVDKELANYRLCGGCLILTNTNVYYVRALFSSKKITVTLPLKEIKTVAREGMYYLIFTRLDGKQFRFRVEENQNIFDDAMRTIRTNTI